LPGRVVHHGFPGPPQLTNKMTDKEIPQVYCKVCDQIRRLVESLPRDCLSKASNR
jgi:hypothetical protein